MIPRLIENLVFSNLLSSQKVILVLGARQVGKTTLVKNINQKLQKKGSRVLYLNCDIDEERAVLDTTSKTLLQKLLQSPKIDVLVIDEAQMLDNPGLTLKIIHDNFPLLKVLATGSSSFDLKNKLSDPLTGRYLDFTLYPFSLTEMLGEEIPKSELLLKNQADVLSLQVMLYGAYPEIYLNNHPLTKQLLLNKLIESYLFKDILNFQRVRNSQAIKDLTRALAYQIGSEINENELATRLKIDRKTVVSYLDILEKAYVIVSSHPYSKNPRREIGKKYKIYFVDLGIRNALIGDFNPVELRQDLGFLWENFLFIERRKLFENLGQSTSFWFWRSYSGAEVDYIEKLTNQDMGAFEFKYTGKTVSRGATSFMSEYSTKVTLVTRENYFDFLKP